MAGQANGGQVTKPVRPHNPLNQGKYVGNPNHGLNAQLNTPANMGLPSQQPANINTLAAEGIKGAGFNTAQGMGYNPLSVGALSSEQLAPYMNPYSTEVIDESQADLLRGENMGLDQLGAQAQMAGGCGGSRHGVAMSELGRGVGELMGQQASGLRQANFAQAQEAARQNQLANQSADLQAQGQRMGAAGQLANISNLGFDMGQTVNQNLQNQGAMQQALQQMILDNAQNKFAGYTGHPAAGIGYLSNALGNTPSTSTDTTTKTPGLFDYLTLGASMMPGR
jgi:hypothetical protein